MCSIIYFQLAFSPWSVRPCYGSWAKRIITWDVHIHCIFYIWDFSNSNSWRVWQWIGFLKAVIPTFSSGIALSARRWVNGILSAEDELSLRVNNENRNCDKSLLHFWSCKQNRKLMSFWEKFTRGIYQTGMLGNHFSFNYIRLHKVFAWKSECHKYRWQVLKWIVS